MLQGPELAQGAEGDVFAAVRIKADGAFRQVALKRMRCVGVKVQRGAVRKMKVKVVLLVLLVLVGQSYLPTGSGRWGGRTRSGTEVVPEVKHDSY